MLRLFLFLFCSLMLSVCVASFWHVNFISAVCLSVCLSTGIAASRHFHFIDSICLAGCPFIWICRFCSAFSCFVGAVCVCVCDLKGLSLGVFVERLIRIVVSVSCLPFLLVSSPPLQARYRCPHRRFRHLHPLPLKTFHSAAPHPCDSTPSGRP